MKTTILATMSMALTTALCLAGPGQPEDNGLTSQEGTHYANTNFYSNGNSVSDGIAIAANGSVLVGWEDDGVGIQDFEGVWTLFDFNLNLLTQPTVQTNRNISGTNGYFTTHLAITNTYLSFFRSDNTPIPACTGWAPKIAANKWGDGIGFGASCWWTGLEISELYELNAWSTTAFESYMPLVQLLNNDGTPYRPGPINGMTNLGILGYATNDVSPAGDIRIADWDYLSNGNIVLAGESHQVADRALTGQASGNVPVFKILTPSGAQVKGYTAASADNSSNNDIWHGVGVTANGFAMKWNKALRLFDNSGNPLSTNINLATLTGHPEAQGSGSRGDNVGFHGNGLDGYVFIDQGFSNYSVAITLITNNPGPSETYTTNYTTNITAYVPWVTVLNTNGTVRWSRAVQDAGDPFYNGQTIAVDGAIAPDGRVIVVFTSAADANSVQGKLFSPCGASLGNRFFISYDLSGSPRVAWRSNKVAVSWVRLYATLAIGVRTFTVTPSAPPTNLAIHDAGGGNVMVSWSGGGTLQSADNINGPWTPNYNCSPYTAATSSSAKFYRVRAW